MEQLIYVTTSGSDEAETIIRALLEERLIACANMLPEIRSMYHWKGSIQDDREVAFFAKTTKDLTPKVIERVKELHSYECPCVVAIDIQAGNPDFLKWIGDETGITG